MQELTMSMFKNKEEFYKAKAKLYAEELLKLVDYLDNKSIVLEGLDDIVLVCLSADDFLADRKDG